MKNVVALYRLLPIVAAFVGATGCAAQTEEPGQARAQENAGQASAHQENVGHAKQADTVTHGYTAYLHAINVSKTRSKNLDTILIGMKALVNEQDSSDGYRTFNPGDYGSGDHYPNYPVPSVYFEASNDRYEDVKVLAAVVNARNPPNAEDGTREFLDRIGLFTNELANGDILPFSNADYWLREEYPSFNSRFASGCDGIVAADAIHMSGLALEGATQNGDFWTWPQRHDGSDSANGCGSNSLYWTQYYIHREW
jgi:hypothetical protein